MNKIILLLSAILLSVLTANAYAQVGKVIIAKGETYAIDTSNSQRILKRRSTILEGDTLITGADGEIQIRFNDNAILALRSNSQLKISEYHAQSNNQSEKVLMELLSGGFRTITGSFGKSDKEAYQIKTPNASIGIRGTNYEAVLSEDELFVGVYYGGVKVNNSNGSIDLGLDSAFRFARVPKQNGRIQGLMQPPAALTHPLTPSSDEAGAENEETKADESAAVQDEDEDALAIENVIQEPEGEPELPDTVGTVVKPELDPVKLLSQTTEQAIAQLNQDTTLANLSDARLTLAQLHELNNNPAVGFVVVNDNFEYLPAYYQFDYPLTGGSLSSDVSFDIIIRSDASDKVLSITIPSGSFTDSDVLDAINNAIALESGTLDNSSTPIPSLVVLNAASGTIALAGYSAEKGSTEIVVTNFTGVDTDADSLKQSLGLCLSTDCASSTFALGAHSTGNNEHSVHFGYVLKGEYGPVFANFESESITTLANGFKSPDNVFTGHPDAEITKFVSLDLNDDGNDDVDWGYWDTDATNPALLMKDPNQLSNSEAIDTGFYYVKATPAPTAALVGTKTLSCNPCTADSWHAQSTTGDITNSGSSSLYADLEVNFASGQAVGNISLADDNQNTWTMTYYGEVKGAQLSSEFAYGTLDYNSVSYEAVGQVDGLFIGDSAQFGVLGGFGFNTTNITQSAEGVFYIPE